MCITKVISHITNIEETPKNDSFLMNAIGVVSTTFQTEGLMSHLIIFYPKDPSVETKIQRIKKDDVVRVAGKFTIEEKNIEDRQVTFIKIAVTNFYIIVIVNGIVMEIPSISETIVKFEINSSVYIEKKKVDIDFNAQLVNGLKMIQVTSLSFVNSTNSNTMLDNQIPTTSPIKINPSVAKIAQQIIGNNNPTNETKERKEQNPKIAQLSVS
nr:8044_t:CDS:2 [Entrophospora candida]